ncbi:MAG: Vi polysaccharide biosynthesis UDP-N-acetylglucosamine C-6 dehydrogenase TviB, partial [Gammaproteobacteria bacterium]|nr:Vi polysaccharide biosynthesis UDP-N-acetylglucosamine C-6 dehydrogenase TviB [Gammaproteobacteria bacterium]
MIKLSEAKIGIIGLGYVGLPLAVEFGKQYPTVGYDISQKRIDALNMGNDATLEVSADELSAANLLSFSSDKKELQACNVYIVTVPTPIDASKKPDLSPLKSASKMLGAVIKPGDVVIYESTVFPGCTEEECVPVIEQESGLKYQTDFFAGYSPERINPGDKAHRLTDILKVTSG